jgi:hypothetical protein
VIDAIEAFEVLAAARGRIVGSRLCAAFSGLVHPEGADQIEWTGPRLLCIAADFTKHDEHAVRQIPRNIELLRYRRYGNSLFLLEFVNAHTLPQHYAGASA